MNLQQLGERIREQRIRCGLSQDQVAKIAGVIRVTVNQLENGALNDLGYAKLEAIMKPLGLDLQSGDRKGLENALSIASRTASTSYKLALSPDTLAQILRTGEAPEQYHPHLMTLLEEAPTEVLVKAVKEPSQDPSMARQIMKHLSQWAHLWKVNRAACLLRP